MQDNDHSPWLQKSAIEAVLQVRCWYSGVEELHQVSLIAPKEVALDGEIVEVVHQNLGCETKNAYQGMAVSPMAALALSTDYVAWLVSEFSVDQKRTGNRWIDCGLL